MNHVWRSTVASLLIALQTGTSLGRVYVVKSGDSLSRVAKRELGNPVYGKKGQLQKILKWNPDIKNPNLIRPAQKVNLGPNQQAAPLVAAPVQAPKDVSTADAPRTNPWAKPKFGLDLDVLIGRSTIEVTSANKQYTSTPHSRLNRGVQLRGYYLLTHESAVGIQISALQSEFAESGDNRLQGVKKDLKHMSLFYHQVLAQRFHLELGLGTEQAYFLSRWDQTKFEIEPIFIDFLKLSFGYDLLATENWRWNVAALAKFNHSASGSAVDAESGKSYGARTSVAYRLKDELFLNAGVQYERRVQDSTQARQRNNDTVGSFGLTLLF